MIRILSCCRASTSAAAGLLVSNATRCRTATAPTSTGSHNRASGLVIPSLFQKALQPTTTTLRFIVTSTVAAPTTIARMHHNNKSNFAATAIRQRPEFQCSSWLQEKQGKQNVLPLRLVRNAYVDVNVLIMRSAYPSVTALRCFSSNTNNDNNNNNSNNTTSSNKTTNNKAHDESTNNEIVLTPGQKVVAASRLTMWFGITIFAGFCAYYIGKELLPTKMSPNRVFDRSFDIIRDDPDVKRRYGDSLKAYGRDHGGHREGRRNFVEHTEYVSTDDGSKRTRVRYNLEGRFGNAFVFAEVASTMPAGEFVYILVQDKANGRVQTVVDNRAALTAARLSAGSKEAQSAMAQLLRGSSGDSNSSTK